MSLRPSLAVISGAEIEAPIAGIALPPCPQLLAQIAQVFPKTDKVTALIAAHPAISDGVLKVVNSPSLGMARNIEKLEQAVVLLGLSGVMNVVNAVLLQSTLSINANPPLQEFWKNTKTTAAAAGMLAIELTGVKPEDAYLLGLFRDCAIPLMYQKHRNYFSVLQRGYNDTAARIIIFEDQEFKANHAIISHYIARAWNLPTPIVQAIRDHHSHRRLMCESADPGDIYVDKLVATLKLAEHVAHCAAIYGKTAKDFEWENYKKPILKLIHRKPHEILDIVNNIAMTLQDTEDLLCD
jgi:HD-like signal output (HDOD) protein